MKIVSLATSARTGYQAQRSISYISLVHTVNDLGCPFTVAENFSSQQELVALLVRGRSIRIGAPL